MSAAVRNIAITVLGANGAAGEYIARRVVNQHLAAISKSGRKVVFAGIDAPALQRLKQQIASSNPSAASSIDIAPTNVFDAPALKELCAKSNVVINCVGPYRFFGEPVVKACVEEKTHYVDICGEPEFIESIMLKYGEEAKARQTVVMSACGFDSIPADVGHLYAAQKFREAHPEGAVSSIECFVGGESPLGFKLHFATWQSAVHGLANASALPAIRKPLRAKQTANNTIAVPRIGPKPKFQDEFFDKRVNKWCGVFPGSDASVVNNTQLFKALESKGKCEPLPYYAEFFAFSLPTFLKLKMAGFWLRKLSQSEQGRSLLLKFPQLFSMGYASHMMLTPEAMAAVSFNLTFFVKGYAQKPSDPKNPGLPDTEMKFVVSGPEPGYVACSAMAARVAMKVLELSDENALKRTGVITPGFAMENTDLVQQLQQDGIGFEAFGSTMTSSKTRPAI